MLRADVVLVFKVPPSSQEGAIVSEVGSPSVVTSSWSLWAGGTMGSWEHGIYQCHELMRSIQGG